MPLFHCRNTQCAFIPEPTTIRTPLGTVRLSVSIGEQSLEATAPTTTCRSSERGWLAAWERNDLDIAVLVCPPEFTPPLEIPVAECWGALWRGKAKVETGPLVFTCTWDEGYTWHEGGANSGQFLYAKSWDDGCTEVTVGTQDEEFLLIRSRQKDYLPFEWQAHFMSEYKSAFWCHPIHHQVLRTGVACPLPSLAAGHEFQIAFAVAWANCDDLSATATSIATEATPEQILAGGGCS